MRHLQTTILGLFILTSCHSYHVVTVSNNTKTNDFRSNSTVQDSNSTKRIIKSSIEGKDTFKLELDSANDFMNKWVYFDLDKPTKLKVITHMVAFVACGYIATASITIGTTERQDTIRVFELCNTEKVFVENDIVIVKPAEKPVFGVHFPRANVQNFLGQILPQNFDFSVLKSTYGIIEKEKTTP
jgi:hypothetical protein